MSFNIALSGLAASQRDLDVTSNNIANVKTTGFKQSRAEFGDVYASSIFTNSRTKVGDGVTTQRVAQQFSQGTLDFTENSLDLAIKGSGFFVTSTELGSQEYQYTRAGAFKLNRENYIVDNAGGFLQTFPVNAETGRTSSTALSTTRALQVPTTAGAPTSTANVYTSFNLDSREQAIDPIANPFDPTVAASYTDSTSATVYDSLGEPHIVTTYYVKRAPNEWDVYAAFDGTEVELNNPDGNVGDPSANGFNGIRIEFNASGQPTNTGIGGPTFPAVNFDLTGLLPNGADDTQNIQVNFASESGANTPTQFASAYELTALDQDGSTVGRLTAVDIDDGGLIAASYSNGQTVFIGRVAMVNFNNEQGLEQVGNSKWRSTRDSGDPLTGEPNTGTWGAIESSALENSNVNLTSELVDIIVAQRNFQANSRSLEVNSTLQQTILQIR